MRVSTDGERGQFLRLEASDEHCAAQAGVVRMLALSGASRGEMDFVFGGGTFGSLLGQALCEIGQEINGARR